MIDDLNVVSISREGNSRLGELDLALLPVSASSGARFDPVVAD